MACRHVGTIAARMTFHEIDYELVSGMVGHAVTVQDVACRECGERFMFAGRPELTVLVSPPNGGDRRDGAPQGNDLARIVVEDFDAI
jgi:hypothetical protein